MPSRRASSRAVAKALGVADPHPLIDDLAVERLGHEVFADTLDLPGLGRIARENRSFGIGADDLDRGIVFLQVARRRPKSCRRCRRPATRAVIRPPVCSQISGPVVR